MNHTIEKHDGGFRCVICGRRWKSRPRSDCPGVPVYERHAAPEHLLTEGQLRKLGLKPGGARVGVVGGFEFPLYDRGQAVPMSEDELAAEKLRLWRKTHVHCQLCGRDVTKRAFNGRLGCCKRCTPIELTRRELRREEAKHKHLAFLAQKKAEAIQKSLSWLGMGDGAVILDCETTGLDLYTDEPVQIGVISIGGDVLLDTLIRPSKPIPPEATAIHGITDEMVANAPTFEQIYPQLVSLLDGKTVIAYNESYDRAILRHTCLRLGLMILHVAEWACAMRMYAHWYGEWSDYYGSFKWQRLEGGHNAIGDCLATLALIRKVAADVVIGVDQGQGDVTVVEEITR
jgi:DNA polymerase-3 subunit epsilon